MTDPRTPPPAPVEHGPNAARAPSASELDRSLVSGLAWTGAVKWGVQVVTWLTTLLVARLLTPEDYGLVAMATLFLGLVDLISEFGIGSAVMKYRNLDRASIAQLNTLAVMLGLVGFGLAMAFAGPLGSFFLAPRLPPVVMTVGTTFILNSFRSVPEATLLRDLQFRRVAMFEGSRAVGIGVAALVLAFAGMGYWALVLSNVFGVALHAGLVLRTRRFPLAWPQLRRLREELSMGGDVLGARLAWYAYSNSDFLIVGKMLGQAALGAYNIGWSLATIPINKITALVGRVTPPIFSAVQNQPELVRRYLLNITEALSLVAFPATVGMGLVADDFVRVVLDDKWLPAVWPLRLLAFYATLRTVQPLLPQVLMIIGESRFNMRLSSLQAVVLPLGFIWAARFGPAGVATAWLVIDPFLVFPSLVRLRSTIGMSFGQYMVALRPALTGCAAMAACVMGTRVLLVSAPPVIRLAAQVAVGAGAYAGTVFFGFGSRVDAVKRALGTLRKPRPTPSPA